MLGLPEAQSACLATKPSLRDQEWDFDDKIMPLIMSFIEFEVSMSVFFLSLPDTWIAIQCSKGKGHLQRYCFFFLSQEDNGSFLSLN